MSCKYYYSIVILFCIIYCSCNQISHINQYSENSGKTTSLHQDKISNTTQHYDSLFNTRQEYIAEDFDFPVGKPNAKGYYNAQKFKVNNHLGDDWNGVGGGNSDLGDPIYTIAHGYVSFAEDIGGGWGNVIRIIHLYKGSYYESVYAHCNRIDITEGDFIKKGIQIGTIGNANGQYYAHLHLEIRDVIDMEIGGGYAKNTSGYLNPTTFINTH